MNLRSSHSNANRMTPKTLSAEAMEPRLMMTLPPAASLAEDQQLQLDPQIYLANVQLNNGILEIDGSDRHDSVIMEEIGTKIRVDITEWKTDDPSYVPGERRHFFDASDVALILFDGLGGDDLFVNETSKPSRAHGGSGDDTLVGGSAGDTLDGEGGEDSIRGEGGSDVLRGGSDADILFGGDGDDVLLGEGGNDVLYGRDGDDTINGGAGEDDYGLDEGRDELHIQIDIGNGPTTALDEVWGAPDGDDVIVFDFI